MTILSSLFTNVNSEGPVTIWLGLLITTLIGLGLLAFAFFQYTRLPGGRK